MCNCVYCRQEPDYPREQHEQANRQADEICDGTECTKSADMAWDMGYAYGKKENEARYQIERAIAQLETPLEDTFAGEDAEWAGGAADTMERVVAQLKDHLAA